MSRTVRKFLAGDSWRIGEHENWFSNMALDGLHLKKVGLLFAHFEKGEPKDTRYRIDTSSNKTVSEEEKEFYKENGWEHISTFGEFNVFSSPAELHVPELHTDPAEQSYTLENLDKKLRTNTYILAVLSALALAVYSMLWFFYKAPTLALVEGEGVLYVCSLLVYAYGMYVMLRGTLSIRKLRATLLAGSPINHKAPWKKHYRINQIVTTTILAIAAVSAVLPWVQLIMQKEETLPLGEVDFPIVRLADIEQNSSFVRDEILDSRSVDIGNRIMYNWSLLAPIQYETNEHGIVPDQVWKDGSTYSPGVTTLMYKLRFPSLKEGLISDLIAKNDVFFAEEDVERLESKVFDILIIREDDGFKEVFAGKGKGVIYVSYFGLEDMDTLLKNVEETIVLIAE
ncbi:DUF2812 domain-containing protein [Sporosarcina sp. G11-34]|uniref:DUF2812 domain-containing protein n=1 Tax=Sporosarcina sp. G11-34 TaxID=2849605 RepID=UPI0022A9ABC5|nr:DUF2812 domain-containing protein [Sporosarcina sp. G11-34]MCZ2260212.1 DUF2812 domain-containing protein [Sporosarcina sp. G11-34]